MNEQQFSINTDRPCRSTTDNKKSRPNHDSFFMSLKFLEACMSLLVLVAETIYSSAGTFRVSPSLNVTTHSPQLFVYSKRLFWKLDNPYPTCRSRGVEPLLPHWLQATKTSWRNRRSSSKWILDDSWRSQKAKTIIVFLFFVCKLVVQVHDFFLKLFDEGPFW